MPQGVGSGTTPCPSRIKWGFAPWKRPTSSPRRGSKRSVTSSTAPAPGDGNGKRPAVKAGTNLLHFARCAKLEKVGDGEIKIWFRTIAIAKAHLDETVGTNRWKWCKICEREITQKILNER